MTLLQIVALANLHPADKGERELSTRNGTLKFCKYLQMSLIRSCIKPSVIWELRCWRRRWNCHFIARRHPVWRRNEARIIRQPKTMKWRICTSCWSKLRWVEIMNKSPINPKFPWQDEIFVEAVSVGAILSDYQRVRCENVWVEKHRPLLNRTYLNFLADAHDWIWFHWPTFGDATRRSCCRRWSIVSSMPSWLKWVLVRLVWMNFTWSFGWL